MRTARHLRRLSRNERGAIFVEFAIVLPLLLLLFAVTIEGARMMWSYQTAVTGVREAARYLGRIVPTNVCAPGQTFPNRDTLLTALVNNHVPDMRNVDGVPTVTVNSVTATLTCVTGDYRVSPAPVAVVSASVTITFPFAGIIAFTGGDLGTLTTTITDRTRVLGS